ncbi:MAG TPA: hypothetical protein VLA03_08970, partial [Draconibacterium sp.]|nr:hypothetical protein [Draconibacterium sp.]
MKKLFTLFFVLIFALPAFTQISSKDIVGNWKYNVVMDQDDLTGVLKFVENEGKLSGEVITSDGNRIPLTKIELKTENKVYLELKTESDLITVSVKV